MLFTALTCKRLYGVPTLLSRKVGVIVVFLSLLCFFLVLFSVCVCVCGGGLFCFVCLLFKEMNTNNLELSVNKFELLA